MTAEYLGVMVALGGLTATVLVFIVQLRTSIRFQRAEYVYRLNEKYDQLCRFRCEHPKLMEFAEPWAEKAMNQMTPDERAYYYYAGMTLGVLETAVYSTFVARTLSLRDFRGTFDQCCFRKSGTTCLSFAGLQSAASSRRSRNVYSRRCSFKLTGPPVLICSRPSRITRPASEYVACRQCAT